MKITAICGWALSEEWFGQLVKSYFPQAEIQAHYPKNPESGQEAVQVFHSKPDWIIGYSLGSLWLLVHKKIIPAQTRIALMAPILAFPAERSLGGKTPLAKLRYQKKMLSSSEDYLASLKGFFDLSGIPLPDTIIDPPHSRETLIRGLDFLETASVSPRSARDCIAVTGSRDSMLDGHQLKKLIPQLIVVEKCDHSPHKLLSHLVEQVQESDNPSCESSQPISSQRIR